MLRLSEQIRLEEERSKQQRKKGASFVILGESGSLTYTTIENPKPIKNKENEDSKDNH